MTAEEMTELEKLARAATPGPWSWEAREENGVKYQHVLAVGFENPSIGRGIANTYHAEGAYFPPGPFAPEGHLMAPRDGNTADAAYIAAFSPAVALALIAEFKVAREDQARLDWLEKDGQCIPAQLAEALRGNRETTVDTPYPLRAAIDTARQAKKEDK